MLPWRDSARYLILPMTRSPWTMLQAAGMAALHCGRSRYSPYYSTGWRSRSSIRFRRRGFTHGLTHEKKLSYYPFKLYAVCYLVYTGFQYAFRYFCHILMSEFVNYNFISEDLGRIAALEREPTSLECSSMT